jgi:hypothetical protein
MTQGDILSDKSVVPTDDLIFSIIKEKKDLWLNLMIKIEKNYEGAAGEWNYYNDGKRWLFKMVRKKKTLFWIGLTDKDFTVTFWFSDKAEQLINESDLPDKFRHEFSISKKYGAVRSISVIPDNKSDVEDVIKLTEIKSKLL